MRLLIADEFPSEHLDSFRSLGLTVDFRPGTRGPALVEAAREASVLVVRSTEVPAAVFENARALSLVVRAGAGVNTIDVKAASAHGVYVANCPGQNALAVAELAWGLILAVDRKLPDGVAALRQGQWHKKRFSASRGLFGRTLGVIGMGDIGRAVAERGKAFGMKVVGYSRSFDEISAMQLGMEAGKSVVDVARRVDVLSIHVPLTAETRQLISREVLAALKTGATFVNTARAEVVDQAALLAEAKSGRLWVATDVYADEPKGGEGAYASALAQLPNVYGSHHIGASTEQAQDAIARETVRIVRAFLAEGVVPNCVNVAKQTPARFQLIVRHFDRVGVLANVLDLIRQEGINAQEIENTVFEGHSAACCKIQLDSRPSDALVARIRAKADEIIFADLIELRTGA